MKDPRPASEIPSADPHDGQGLDAAGTSAAPSPAAGECVPPNQLTPEEQMARFAEELKHNDWGHQPC